MTDLTYKPISKIHVLAMARRAGLAIQDDKMFFLNDLASEKELLAFARLLERAIHQERRTPSGSCGPSREQPIISPRAAKSFLSK